MPRTLDIQALRGMIRDREAGTCNEPPRSLAWLIDVRLSAVHEWFVSDAPPLAILAHMAARALHARVLSRVLWIGRKVFPYPLFLDARVLAASVFVDASDADARLWAADVALRSGVRSCVILDACRFTLACTRRLQLAARSGVGVALLARPEREASVLSAATTRWLVEPARESRSVAWMLTLVRNKDDPTAAMERPRWMLRGGAPSDDGVRVPALVASRATRTTA